MSDLKLAASDPSVLRALIARWREEARDLDLSAERQTLLDCADELEALVPPAEAPPPDNGNTFVFCDYVGERYGGCIRGAGHNGPHVFSRSYPVTYGPVLLEKAEATPPYGEEDPR